MSVINTNVPALIAETNLNLTGMSLSKSIEQLSSGLRINHAADDAAGLAISQALTAQVNGTQQAVRNGQDGVSMVQTADGALNEVQSILQRMNELAVQAANGDLNPTDRNAIQLELNQLTSSMQSISQNTQFNGLNLLTGNLSVTYATGSGPVSSTDANLIVTAVDLSGAAASTNYTFSICATKSTATYASPTVTQTITIRSMTGNDAQLLNFNAIGIKVELTTAQAVTVISATQILQDLATTSNFSTSNTSGATTIQIGANAGLSNELALNFNEIDPITLGLNAGVVNVSTTAQASTLITAVQTAINLVSNQRATLGALENSLNHTINNLNVANENLTAANSRILDLNVASATVDFTKEQILQQAGTSVLYQANILPQSVLTLLR